MGAKAWDGTVSALPWTSYTPALTATTTNPNVGSTGSVLGWYTLEGLALKVRFEVTFGGSGINAGSGTYLFSMPPGFTPARSGAAIVGTALVRDNSVPAAVPRFANFSTGTQLRLMDVAGVFVNNNTPYAWAAADTIVGQVEYEVTP